jgi:cyclopropane-fatty-acyl-phospholipid synthase
MIEKRIFHQVLLRIRQGAIKVTYWDGTTVTYGAGEPYLHITLKTAKVARAMIKNLTLGFGEGYMDGSIEVEGSPDQIMRIATENKPTFAGFSRLASLRHTSLNVRSKQASQIQHHYDLGNDFYKLWLDTSMTYSCAYFHTAKDTLEQAQANKVDHLLRKLQLEKGHSLLDIGSGWGTLLIEAAKRYGVSGTGITLSKEQWQHSTQAAKDAGVGDRIKFELMGYQDMAERGLTFDRIISVGMFEHVGKGNQIDYFKAVASMLKPGAISVLHTISTDKETGSDPWIDKYIFPGGYIPAVREVIAELPNHDFRLIDYENLRMHYAMTLDEWLRRYESHKSKVIKMYDERFYRMWRLYLASSSASFRYGDLGLSQFVFTKGLNNSLPLTRAALYK